MIFEYTLPGFDGGTDKTDHLVKWVSAANKKAADAAMTLAYPGATYCGTVQGATNADCDVTVL